MLRDHRCVVVAVALMLSAGIATSAPVSARGTVTYEVVSDSITVADIEYVGQGGRTLIKEVPLPWRAEVVLEDAQGPTGSGAQLRADWRRIRGPARWVTVRILDGVKLLCQSTLDVGNVTCYGNTPHRS